MNILLCIPSVTSYHTFLSELSAFLFERGHIVHIAASPDYLPGTDRYERPVVGEYHPIAFPRGGNILQHVRAARQLSRVVGRINPDITHVHFSATAFTAAIARSRLVSTVIATIQGLITPTRKGSRRWVMQAAETFAYRRHDAVWVLTADDYEFLGKMLPPNKARLQRSLGFGCVLERFDRRNYHARLIQERRLHLGIREHDTVFAFVGRRTCFKGFHIVVRSFFRLLDAGAAVKLVLLGITDPQHDTGLTVAETDRLSRCMSVVDFGWTPDVASLLVLADVNVFPSVREGVPVNLMESLALGVPVVTLNTRGCRHVVTHGIDGLVADGAGVDQVTSAMQCLIRDRPLRERLSANALAGRDRFDRNHWINEQIRIYEGLHNDGIQCGLTGSVPGDQICINRRFRR